MTVRQAASRCRSLPSSVSPWQRGTRRVRVVCAAGERKQLPIFPLSMVALPVALVPLRIFEARYRVLFNTLLDGCSGIEDGLVIKESPFAGTKRFGLCFYDDKGRLASVGTTLEIQEHVKDSEGRLFITNKGMERFKILKVLTERPVLTCEVEVLDEDNDTSEEAVKLAAEVGDLFRNTIRLHVKMNNITTSEDVLEPTELLDASPRELSYWIASIFSDVRPLQQILLEEDSTIARLQRERDVLTETVKYYSAASALKSAFNAPVPSAVSTESDPAVSASIRETTTTEPSDKQEKPESDAS